MEDARKPDVACELPPLQQDMGGERLLASPQPPHEYDVGVCVQLITTHTGVLLNMALDVAAPLALQALEVLRRRRAAVAPTLLLTTPSRVGLWNAVLEARNVSSDDVYVVPATLPVDKKRLVTCPYVIVLWGNGAVPSAVSEHNACAWGATLFSGVVVDSSHMLRVPSSPVGKFIQRFTDSPLTPRVLVSERPVVESLSDLLPQLRAVSRYGTTLADVETRLRSRTLGPTLHSMSVLVTHAALCADLWCPAVVPRVAEVPMSNEECRLYEHSLRVLAQTPVQKLTPAFVLHFINVLQGHPLCTALGPRRLQQMVEATRGASATEAGGSPFRHVEPVDLLDAYYTKWNAVCHFIRNSDRVSHVIYVGTDVVLPLLQRAVTRLLPRHAVVVLAEPVGSHLTSAKLAHFDALSVPRVLLTSTPTACVTTAQCAYFLQTSPDNLSVLSGSLRVTSVPFLEVYFVCRTFRGRRTLDHHLLEQLLKHASKPAFHLENCLMVVRNALDQCREALAPSACRDILDDSDVTRTIYAEL